jgi:hypothetical protein
VCSWAEKVSVYLECLLDSFILLSVGFVVFRELEVTLTNVNELLLVEFIEVLESEFINGVVEKEDFVAFLE